MDHICEIELTIIPDLEEEIIVLKSKDNVDITTLPSKVPTECARYHLFRYKHNYEGDSLESNGMIC